MGIFDKLKRIVNNKEKEVKTKDEVESYSKGLEKTRNEFVSKLNVLGIKYTKIDKNTDAAAILITSLPIRFFVRSHACAVFSRADIKSANMAICQSHIFFSFCI